MGGRVGTFLFFLLPLLFLPLPPPPSLSSSCSSPSPSAGQPQGTAGPVELGAGGGRRWGRRRRRCDTGAGGRRVRRGWGWAGPCWAFRLKDLPSARPSGTRQRFFYFFFKFFAERPVTWRSAKASLPSAKVGTRQFFFFYHFFLGPCYSN